MAGEQVTARTDEKRGKTNAISTKPVIGLRPRTVQAADAKSIARRRGLVDPLVIAYVRVVQACGDRRRRRWSITAPEPNVVMI